MSGAKIATYLCIVDALTRMLLRLTPEERREIAREVAARLTSADDDAVQAEWLRALQRRFSDDEEPEQLALWSDRPDAR
jgi:hypothetical protein